MSEIEVICVVKTQDRVSRGKVLLLLVQGKLKILYFR